jgi:hypothetical protein
MRLILWATLVLGVLWGGYWVAGSRAIEGGVAAWFAQAESQGIQASQSGISVSGFANRFDLTVTEPHLSDPATGWGWQAPFAQVLAMTWKPWHVIAVLPHDQHILAPGQDITLTSTKLDASVRVTPSTDAALAEVVIEGHDLLAQSDLGWTLGAKSVVAALARDTTMLNGQRFGVDVTDLTPDPALAALVPDLGQVISQVHLDATATLSAPLDRHIAETQPRLTGLRLTDFHMTWGSLVASASGQIAPDAARVAEGKIAFRFKNWRTIPPLLAALGLVQPGMANSITSGLEAMAASGKDPTILDLDLTFAKGRMTLGPLPLGPAPQMN